MAIAVLMPALSPTMSEGSVAKWIKEEGDLVEPGQILAEIETDKATMEVEAVDSGVLGKIVVNAGTTGVKVNNLIAIILEDGEGKEAIDKMLAEYEHDSSVHSEQDKSNFLIGDNNIMSSHSTSSEASSSLSTHSGVRKFITPLARRIAANEGVDISGIQGTGPGGRILKRDIVAKIAQQGPKKSSSSLHSSHDNSQSTFSVQKLSNIRKTIATRLVESKQNIPHFYLSLDCDVDSIMELRKDLNDSTSINIASGKAYKISVNDIVIKAVALAMARVPEVNSSWSDDGIIVYDRVDISIAVAIEDGLITPIVRAANTKSLGEISEEVKSLAEKAKSGKLMPEEYQGGGFSISNLGMYGIKSFSAIINPPQSAILAVGAVTKQPVVKGNDMKIGSVMNMTLSCDHRVIDGAKAAEFLSEVRKIIEKPALLLL
ncbi:pyruvate dehydrogenase complex dihydrolipoamide acetyltransferase [Candidatus Lariskella endosymbiont of Hedychridium roseum]|uniref:pyruvate dehydrogenase complex dihydrolipoamide acetyltransferase n=1 Tax=Candidatus Lariskella endosymbiont of Hedychridium roseum TaxID=3077949 RepID=UPI0030CFF929